MHLLTCCLVLFASVYTFPAWAQNDRRTEQNLFFIRRGRTPHSTNADYVPRGDGFYIYRNYPYEFILKGGKWVSYRVTDIRNDSLYGVVYRNGRWDSLSLSPRQLKAIRVFVGAFSLGTIFNVRWNMALRNYVYVFEQGELVRRYYTDTEDTTNLMESTRPRKGVWFTPSGTSTIRGVNIGISTENFYYEKLSIKGVNINADVFSAFIGYFGLLTVPFGNRLMTLPDTLVRRAPLISVRGVSLSAGGLTGKYGIDGFAINGAICLAQETSGVVISGTQNIITSEFRGVMICGLRNRAPAGRGVQIGLVNVCKHLKGIQLGLWNVNSKRSLPFVNWAF